MVKQMNNDKNYWTILVVEDDEGLNKLIRKILKRSGYHTEGVLCGTDAVRRIRENPEKLLVLLDYRLPDINGDEVIINLAGQKVAAPFLVMTGQGDEKTAVKMMKLGARNYLVKENDFLALLPRVVDRLFKELVTDELLRATHEKLRSSEEKYRLLFETMTQGVVFYDSDGLITSANPAAERILGLPQDQIVGRTCHDPGYKSIHEDRSDFPAYTQPAMVSLKSGKAVTNVIMGIYHPKEKDYRWVVVNAIPKFKAGQEYPYEAYEIFTDITELKRIEADLIQAQKMEAIGTLAGGIAHDFNNILSAIIGYAELTMTNPSEESSVKVYNDHILKAGNRAKELVKQILTFSQRRLETQLPLQPSPIIKEALNLIRASLPTTIQIQEKIEYDCGPILANPTNIHQVLVNLCTNALLSMEDEKGVLTVKLTRVVLNEADLINESGMSEGPFVELIVSDTGVGMDKATVERIFEPYFTTRENGKGTGMGLALVHGIVQGCGGFIRVESEPGKGTTFNVYFPVIKEKNVEIKKEQQELLPTGIERILIVDDEEAIIGLYKTTLEKLGYKITAYSSSKKMLEAFRSAPDNFDLIITDQTMPNLPGSELAKKILQIRPNIPIVLCTGYSSMISEKKAKEIGIEKFLMKPVEVKILAKIVREILDKSKPQQTIS